MSGGKISRFQGKDQPLDYVQQVWDSELKEIQDALGDLIANLEHTDHTGSVDLMVRDDARELSKLVQKLIDRENIFDEEP